MATVNNEVTYSVTLRDLMSSAINKIKGATDNLNNSVSNTNKNLLQMRNAPKFINQAMGALGISLGVAGMVNFGRQVIDALKNYEYFSASLRTLMKGDVQTAKVLETQLISLAKQTPFSLVEVQDATKQLLAYGFSAGSVTKNIKMLGDVASALKIPFGDIAYLYGTLRTQGRAYTRDINQFTTRGIPIIKELAKQYKTTENNVMSLVEKGKVGFADVEKAFISMTSKGGMFFNMMETQSKTVGGQISNLADSWEQMLVSIGKSKTGVINIFVKGIGSVVSHFQEKFSAENYLDEAFAEMDIQKSFAQKYLPSSPAFMSLKNLAASAVETEERASGGDVYKAISLMRAKTKELTDLRKQYKYEEIDIVEFTQKAAILTKNLKNLRAIVKTLSMKPQEGAQTAPAETPSELSTAAAEAKAPKYTQINISIAKMQASENLYIESGVKQSENQIANRVLEMLTGALNDSQRMAGAH